MRDEGMRGLTRWSPGDKGVPQHRVQSLASYIKMVDAIASEWRVRTKRRADDGKLRDGEFPGEMVPWFRGTTNVQYSLEPTLLRNNQLLNCYNQNKKNIKVIERYLLQRFRFGGRREFSTLRVDRSIDWVFLMQHHGLPTRLLDWSKNALTALYFAIRKQKNNDDAAVWVIDPRRLSEACSLGRSIVFPTGDKEKLLRQYYSLTQTTTKPAYPIPVIPPPLLSERLAAQQSRFTYHTEKRLGLEQFAIKFARADKCWYLVKLIIPCGKTQIQILRTLRLVGITLPDITPGLDNIALEILHRLELGIDDLAGP